MPKEIRRWGSQLGSAAGGVPLQVDEQPTNGLTYATILLDVSGLPDRLVPYLDLFSDFMTELGTAVRDYKQLAQAEKATTGGISASISATPSMDGSSAPEVRPQCLTTLHLYKLCFCQRKKNENVGIHFH